jgi:hypothetical protein
MEYRHLPRAKPSEGSFERFEKIYNKKIGYKRCNALIAFEIAYK